MRRDPYSTEPAKSKHGKPATTTAQKRGPAKVINFFGDNPPVRLEITYRNGDKDIFKGAQIDADNPVIRALSKIRTCRRFWTDMAMPEGKQAWSTDEELLTIAAQLGIPTPEGTIAERATKVAERLGLTPKYFRAGDDGEPLEDDKGLWTEADPGTADAYTPGTHVPT